MDDDVVKLPITAFMCQACTYSLLGQCLLQKKLRQSVPDDGLPILEDWLTVFEGMVFGGPELAREPVDVSVPSSVRVSEPSSFNLALFVNVQVVIVFDVEVNVSPGQPHSDSVST